MRFARHAVQATDTRFLLAVCISKQLRAATKSMRSRRLMTTERWIGMELAQILLPYDLSWHFSAPGACDKPNRSELVSVLVSPGLRHRQELHPVREIRKAGVVGLAQPGLRGMFTCHSYAWGTSLCFWTVHCMQQAIDPLIRRSHRSHIPHTNRLHRLIAAGARPRSRDRRCRSTR